MNQVPLNLYYSSAREDNFTTATEAGRASALSAGYEFVRTEGWVDPSSGARELTLWYHSGRGDNLLTATSEGTASAKAAGYTFVRIEGGVSAGPGPGDFSLPGDRYLEQWWHAGRQDNFLTGTTEGTESAKAAGYLFVRNEGMCTNPLENGLVVLWNAGRGDNMTVASSASIASAGAEAYQWASEYIAVQVASERETSATRLQLWYHAGRQDHLTVASAEGIASARESNYSYVRDEGWVLSDSAAIPTSRITEVRQYWHPTRQDNFLAPTPDTWKAAESSGYQFVRVEGYLVTPPEIH